MHSALKVAHSLIRHTIRAFYTDEHAAVVEFLLRPPYFIVDDHSVRGDLNQSLGGASARTTRQTLVYLNEHSMVHKCDIDGKTYFYIDYIHFIKIVKLRLALLSESIDRAKSVQTAEIAKFVCPTCKQKFNDMDLAGMAHQNGHSLCPQDGSRVESIKHLPEIASTARELEKKYTKQLKDLTGGIFDRLAECDRWAREIPLNEPKIHLEDERRLKGELARDAYAAAGNKSRESKLYGDNEHLAAGATASHRALPQEELPQWFKVSSVTGKVSEAQLQVEEWSNKLKAEGFISDGSMRGGAFGAIPEWQHWSGNLEPDDATSAFVEHTSLLVDPLAEEEKTSQFRFADGRVKAVPDLTEDDVARMSSDELESYSKILTWNAL